MGDLVSLIKQEVLFEDGGAIRSETGTLPVMTIVNTDIYVREYNGKRVVAFNVIDALHERPEGTAKRNFNTNKKRFIANEDYFLLKNKDLEGVRNSYGLDNRINQYYLFTEQGYLMLVKSFTDDLAWQIQKELVNNYFKMKEVSSEVDPLNFLQGMLDTMKQQAKQIAENQNQLLQQKQQLSLVTDKVDDIHDKMNIYVESSWIQANAIAKQIGMYSMKGLPHAGLISSIAKTIKMRVKLRQWFQDEDISIVAKREDDKNYWEVYYKPAGIAKILEWWEVNQTNCHFVNLYKRKSGIHEVGDIRETGYRVYGVSYIVKE